jgi:outer membrane protein assembly factor BamB
LKTIASVALAVLVLVACASGRSPRDPPAPLENFSAQARAQELWQVDTGTGPKKDYVQLIPLVLGKRIIAADAYGRVGAWLLADGRSVWKTNVEAQITGAVGGGDDLIVVGTKKGRVVALRADDGKPAWKADVTSEILAPPAVGSGVVVVQCVDGRLFGLATQDGRRLWVFDQVTEPALTLRGTSAPVIYRDVVITGFANGKVAALTLKEGKSLWELAVSLPRGRNEIERLVDVDASPLLINGILFAVSYQGKIVAVDARTGQTLWGRDLSSFTGLDADQANIYATDEHGNVIAFDQRSGASVWKQEKLRGRSLNAPTYIDGFIVVGDFEGYLHWLSREDGRFVARHHVGGSAIRARVLRDGNLLYVTNQGGSLAAIRLSAR